MKFFLPLLFATQVWGQAFTQNDLPWLAQTASAQIPQTIPGLYLWWNYKDLPPSGNVSNWVDRVQGSVLSSVKAADYPINTPNGVWFWGNLVNLTNTSLPYIGSNWTVFISLAWTNLQTGAFGIAPLWTGTNINFAFGSANQLSPKAQALLIDDGGSPRSFGTPAAYLAKFTDWTLMCSNNANGGTGNTFCYTNGLFAQVETTLLPESFKNVGWTANYNDGSTYPVVSIRDIIIYTNSPAGGPLNALQVALLHQYRTNIDLTTP